MPGRVLELGCGPGRNAIYMAEKGYKVDAIDISEHAIEWGKDLFGEDFLWSSLMQIEK